jgi:hypothetical protein
MIFGNPEPPSQLALLSKQTLTLENIKQALHKFKDNKGSDDVGVVAERANFALVDFGSVLSLLYNYVFSHDVAAAWTITRFLMLPKSNACP